MIGRLSNFQITWKDDEKWNENIKLIISEARRMTEMVNDILDYSQLQAGYLPLKKDVYNLYEIVDTEVMNCEKIAGENNIHIELDSTCTEIPVLLDALKISQVIRNLLYKAINHTQDGSTITVKIADVVNGVRVSGINPGTDGHNTPNNGFVLTKRLVLPYKKRKIRLPANPSNTSLRL